MNILITGKNGYIAKSLEKWLLNYPEKYNVDMLSLRSRSWEKIQFEKYDVVVHLAGIVHMKKDKIERRVYYEINRDLTIDLANKCSNENVRHFIFLSTMSVYGIENGVIDENTIPKPNTDYGLSKLEAEDAIKKLENKNFTVSIIRPPMVYGKNCKGNYGTLLNFSKNTLFFPDINNYRSMIYIDNLNEFIKIIIDEKIGGTFFPQNKEFVCTTDIVKLISKYNKNNVIFIPKLEWIIELFMKKINIFKKIFGNLVYSKEISSFEYDYQVVNFEQSIFNSL